MTLVVKSGLARLADMSKSVVNIAVIGVTGGVGRTLVKQLQARVCTVSTYNVRKTNTGFILSKRSH